MWTNDIQKHARIYVNTHTQYGNMETPCVTSLKVTIPLLNPRVRQMGGRWRKRERDRQRHRQRETETKRQRDRQTDRQTATTVVVAG